MINITNLPIIQKSVKKTERFYDENMGGELGLSFQVKA